jgi:hypothetical protein
MACRIDAWAVKRLFRCLCCHLSKAASLFSGSNMFAQDEHSERTTCFAEFFLVALLPRGNKSVSA